MKKFILVFCILHIPLFSRAETLIHLQVPVEFGSLKSNALNLVLEHAAQLGNKKPNLTISQLHPIPDGQVIRIEQTFRGLPVVDGNVAVIMQHSHFMALTGQLHDLSLDAIAFHPKNSLLTSNAALQAVRTILPDAHMNHARLAFWAGPPFASQEVWVIQVATGNPFGAWELFVSALDGKLLWGRSTLIEAKAKVYEINPNKGNLVDKNLEGLTRTDSLIGEFADVSSCYGTALSASAIMQFVTQCNRLAKPDEQGNYYYNPLSPSANDPFAEAQAYYQVESVHRWYEQTFNYVSSKSQVMPVRVNYQLKNSSGQMMALDNAFFNWNSGQDYGLYLGLGTKNRAYDGKVVSHEFTHSIVNETSNLKDYLDTMVHNTTPSALNEAFADLMTAIHYNDPALCDYSCTIETRNLEGTASCPLSLYGESHYDGLIWSQALWSIRKKAVNKTNFDRVAYKIMTSLTTRAAFADAAALFLKIAQQTDASIVPLAKEEFKNRNIETCSPIVPLAPDVLRNVNVGSQANVLFSGFAFAPATLQYKIDVPPNATKLEIVLTGKQALANQAGALIRRGETILLKSANDIIYDFRKPNNASPFVLSTTDAKFPLAPGATYYVLPINESTNSGPMSISYKLTTIALDKGAGMAKDAGGSGFDYLSPTEKGVLNEDPNTPQVTTYSGCSCSIAQRDCLGYGLDYFLLVMSCFILYQRGRSRKAG